MSTLYAKNKDAGIQPFEQQCSAAFGVSPEQTAAAVAWNSANYGDNQPGGTRILFINGDIDPFHFGSVMKNSSELLERDIVALVVAGGSHCADMGPLDLEQDSSSMIAVKSGKAETIARWLAQSPPDRGSQQQRVSEARPPLRTDDHLSYRYG
eukprot:SAG31_NODE_1625_length_7716_cov_23.849941_6_plen_153_part_00